MKAIICGECLDIRGLNPFGAFVSCRCGNVTARWDDPHAGTVLIKADDRSKARILGMNNHFLLKAVDGIIGKDILEAGGDKWDAFKQLHDKATDAPGYLFDKSKCACWAVVIRVGESNDVKWMDE
jgi:hypothetical protein